MKKLLLTTIAAISIMSSCKKENKNTPTNINNSSLANNTAARVMPNNTMESYISDPADEQNERINKALYNYMVGMKKVFESDLSFLSNALALAKTSPLKTINLHRFVCETSACKALFNGELTEKYPENGNNFEYCCKILEDMHYTEMRYGKIDYEPGLYIVNAEEADLTEGYYLALAEEAQSTDENHDYIPAWHILKNGETRLELIHEQQAKQSKEPVIIFTPIAGKYYNPSEPYQPPVYTEPKGKGDPYIPTQPPVGTIWTPSDVKHSYVHISQRFERWGASDYRISQGVTNASGGIEQTPWRSKYHLADVPRNYVDCHCYFSLNNQGFYSATDYNTVIHYVTYEHDWYVTEQPIQNANVTLWMQAKYRSETYNEVYNKASGTFLPNTGNYTFDNNNQLHNVYR